MTNRQANEQNEVGKSHLGIERVAENTIGNERGENNQSSVDDVAVGQNGSSSRQANDDNPRVTRDTYVQTNGDSQSQRYKETFVVTLLDDNRPADGHSTFVDNSHNPEDRPIIGASPSASRQADDDNTRIFGDTTRSDSQDQEYEDTLTLCSDASTVETLFEEGNDDSGAVQHMLAGVSPDRQRGQRFVNEGPGFYDDLGGVMHAGDVRVHSTHGYFFCCCIIA